MKKLWLLLPLACFLVLAVFLYRGLYSNPRELNSVLVGKAVPDFQKVDLFDDNKHYDQKLLATGQPVLLNVWATWCPTCYAEHQFLNTLARQGVRIVGVNYKDERNAAVDWLSRLGNPYEEVLFDPKGQLGLDLGVYGAPETFLIDGQGVIRYRHVGDVNDRVWNQTLKPIYNGLKP
ncbi:DsbE family thiol:disulfide interchange protein [Gallaecimonas pentaromativorans]|uniref:Thiol:disulfide interchange protein DsbE n=1 Tax=Gallaecimonas pentaromativorans TaxID=584787 RepID=A0A3N1NUN6_9GAMM|nr:DsbE family thiol:disulfide interchange protein [Gallaecimonas pentaromativorans]MED5526653.1 DsbE family thiol:disulfide interchange protein [Pseudomonadota bacterium]ROQ22552.1 cytochrome c biogenesis protein CcmG/thiol:disulfide interchange protein DsbE [Gallaecimonas pentaromativorans]